MQPGEGDSRELQEVQQEVFDIVERLNATYGSIDGRASKTSNGEAGKVVELINRGTTLAERIALLSVADCAVVTATRDGMNLLPYEYITCRQGPVSVEAGTADGYPLPRQSSLIMSSLSDARAHSPELSG